MRCSLRSYVRYGNSSYLVNYYLCNPSILDPILHDLIDPSITWTATTISLSGRQLQGFIYEQPIDQRYISYLLELLQSVIRFGGQGFAKTARSNSIERSLSAQLKHRVEAGA
jgi:hypothetical protein